MYKPYLLTAAILGALAVALGAFGAHGLKTKVNADTLQVFETAVKYQFWHVFALMAVAILYQTYPSTIILWSGKLFVAGIILFSGSLYALTFFRAAGNESMNWLGAITPLGGVSFIAGWVLLILGVWKG
jgi:uncharacterized membrane protein YgdD (TMEM256/DUF423 family)